MSSSYYIRTGLIFFAWLCFALLQEEPAPEQQAPIAARNKYSPSDFLKSVLGRPVRVQLNTGLEYRGILACLDGYLNLALEQSEEFRDGQLQAKYGDCFIRGNNGESIILINNNHGRPNPCISLICKPCLIIVFFSCEQQFCLLRRCPRSKT